MGMVAVDVFQLEPHQNGYLMSYVGLMAMVSLQNEALHKIIIIAM